MKKILEENNELLERYKFICRSKGLTNSSIESSCGHDLRLYLEYLGDKKALEATHEDIQKFLMHCSSKRKNKDKTLNRKHTNIGMFYSELIIKMDLEMRNPILKVDKIKVRKTVRPFLKKLEYKQFMNCLISMKDIRGIALTKLFYSSSCRLSEIWQLNIESLDFENRRFIVVGKGQKERECMFSEDAAKAIKEYLATRNDNDPALFISKYGTRLSKKGIQDYFGRRGKKAGLTKKVHPHLFRHTRAMHLLEDGIRIETLKELLGHTTIATTQMYAHMMFSNVAKKIDEVDKLYALDTTDMAA